LLRSDFVRDSGRDLVDGIRVTSVAGEDDGGSEAVVGGIARSSRSSGDHRRLHADTITEGVSDGARSGAGGGSFEGDERDGVGVVSDGCITEEGEDTRSGEPFDLDVGGECEVELVLAGLVVVLNHDGSGGDDGSLRVVGRQVESGEDEGGLLARVEERNVRDAHTSGSVEGGGASTPRARTDLVAGVHILVAALSDGREAEEEVSGPEAHVGGEAFILLHSFAANEGLGLAGRRAASGDPVAVRVADATSDVSVEVGAVVGARGVPRLVSGDIRAVLGDDHFGFKE
jgi:hypothetical protein